MLIRRQSRKAKGERSQRSQGVPGQLLWLAAVSLAAGVHRETEFGKMVPVEPEKI
jgi:hypothetical protein